MSSAVPTRPHQVGATSTARPSSGTLEPLGVRTVQITSGFWAQRQALNVDAIIPHAAGWVERLGWLGNLEDAAAGKRYDHRGREFADSEIFKLIEAMSWETARAGERSELNETLDRFLDAVVGAQDPDGYLHTLFGRAWQAPRYSDFKWGHELYCFGHLMQSAVAHYRATGSRRFLDVAVRLADHVCVMFGPDGLNQVCGHAEIELGLTELYRVTSNRRYLDQAALFIERRGTGTLPLFEFGPAFWQDDTPVRVADVLRGHAVRALYLAAGAVDVAIETGDADLLGALKVQWDNTVARRTYITGGMGSHHMDEAFGEDFVLPPDRSYCETCAGVAAVLFSWRLLLATGDAKYADLIERVLYNIVATSPSEAGTSFFYANTLHQRVDHAVPSLNEDGVVIRGGAAGRQPWYEVSCCPPNVARLLASLGDYLATQSTQGIQIHQLASATIRTDSAAVEVTTNYPADGTVRVRVADAPVEGVTVSIRVPAWARSATLAFRDETRATGNGYITVGELVAGEEFVLEIPMDVRVTRADRRIDAVRGAVAFERGPEVFALESVDLPENWSIDEVVADALSAHFDGETLRVTLDGTRGHANVDGWPYGTRDEGTVEERVEVALVRYHAWAERGPATMRIWIPESGRR
ncbi:glycoside hydrolase family 127 protein [Leifsonia sp. NPDC014704]|uniref:glycoside hydrolase family 127 protein n=1 Tax=Leifsonia sp. NPDC014704 TaxID=3364123 RepID=UPI0036F4AEEC